MALEQLYLTGRNKVEEAIFRIRQHEPGGDGYHLAFSGGKDSETLMDLTIKSGVKFVAYYCRTGIDPPELVKFIRENYPEVIFLRPLMTMWEGILIHGLPLRQRRWCCQVLKEHAGNNQVLLQGVRWAESARRRKRWDVFSDWKSYVGTSCGKITKAFCSPIIDWSDDDVWQYITENNLPYCRLYDEGFKRLGCVLCPFSQGKGLRMEIERYPKIVEAYGRAANRYYERRGKDKMVSWQSGDDYFEWWIRERLPGYSLSLTKEPGML